MKKTSRIVYHSCYSLLVGLAVFTSACQKEAAEVAPAVEESVMAADLEKYQLIPMPAGPGEMTWQEVQDAQAQAVSNQGARTQAVTLYGQVDQAYPQARGWVWTPYSPYTTWNVEFWSYNSLGTPIYRGSSNANKSSVDVANVMASAGYPKGHSSRFDYGSLPYSSMRGLDLIVWVYVDQWYSLYPGKIRLPS